MNDPSNEQGSPQPVSAPTTTFASEWKAEKRFVGGLLMAIGGLIALLSGLCSLWAGLTGGAMGAYRGGGVLSYVVGLLMGFVFGAVPIAIGVFLVVTGRRMYREGTGGGGVPAPRAAPRPLVNTRSPTRQVDDRLTDAPAWRAEAEAAKVSAPKSEVVSDVNVGPGRGCGAELLMAASALLAVLAGLWTMAMLVGLVFVTARNLTATGLVEALAMLAFTLMLSGLPAVGGIVLFNVGRRMRRERLGRGGNVGGDPFRNPPSEPTSRMEPAAQGQRLEFPLPLNGSAGAEADLATPDRDPTGLRGSMEKRRRGVPLMAIGALVTLICVIWTGVTLVKMVPEALAESPAGKGILHALATTAFALMASCLPGIAGVVLFRMGWTMRRGDRQPPHRPSKVNQ